MKVRAPLPDEDEEPPSLASAAALTAMKPAPPPTATIAKRKSPPAPIANRGNEKRVRRGHVEVEASLDLHGYTQDTAFAALIRFLAAAHARNSRTVIVVTGQGRGGEGVLKKRFRDWIEARELKPIIAGYAQAHRMHGGAGAFYVFLKRKAE